MTVFFDIGATLVTGPDEGPAKRLARELSLDPQVKARIAAAIMTENWMCAEDFLGWLSAELGNEWKQTSHMAAARGLWEAQTCEARPIDGAPETMAALLDAGLPVGLVSNIWHPYFDCARRAYDGLFERAAETAPQVLSCRAGTAKPAAAIYEQALSACGRAACETIMVGDTYETDMAPAIALGIATIWVLHRPDAEREHLAAVRAGALPQPDLVVESITEVAPELVRELLKPATWLNSGFRPTASTRPTGLISAFHRNERRKA
jgi:FMN phosphatase YigB (HAD superfamily)